MQIMPGRRLPRISRIGQSTLFLNSPRYEMRPRFKEQKQKHKYAGMMLVIIATVGNYLATHLIKYWPPNTFSNSTN